jgi:protein-S-isoprenylcysteine O-methyltransferase Ste14
MRCSKGEANERREEKTYRAFRAAAGSKGARRAKGRPDTLAASDLRCGDRSEPDPACALSLPWFGSPMSDILVAVGWLSLLAMAALFLTAFRAMARAKTPINPNAQPEHLVTEGPFGITRNPIYLADTLLLIGVGLVSGITWFLPLAVIAAFITQKVAIDKEERWLADKFGKRYRDYAKRVRRWI